MPSKTEEYLALAQRTANGLTRYWEHWTDYLTTASRLYKYSFADQLMIYAQRPDATACASFDIWNNRMNRYVRRGSKGIALLDQSSSVPRLHYVFDVSDTGVRRNSRDPEVWQLNDDLFQPVSEMLAREYGIHHERLSQQIADIAGKLAESYWDNNSSDILGIVDGSFLMDYDEAGQELQFKSAAAISIMYTILERCGFEPEGYFDRDDFQAIYDFSTPDAVYALGAAVSDCSRDVLRNIERTVKTTIRRRNVERSQHEYDEQERDLLDRRGLPAPEPDLEPAAEAAGPVRTDAPDVPDGESPGAVQLDAADREAASAPAGSGAGSGEPEAADDDRTAEAEPSPGQSEEPTDVGATHEQPESTGGRSDPDGTDLQLSFFNLSIPTEAQQIEAIDRAENEKSSSAFSLSQAEIEHELRKHGSGFQDGKQRIIELYQTQPDKKLRAKALAKEYGIGGHSHDYLDGSSGFVNYDGKGLEFVHYPDYQKIPLSWIQVEKYIDLMIQSDRYLTDAEKEQRTVRQEAERQLPMLDGTVAAEYTVLKEQYPNTLVGFELNGNYLFYDKDAVAVERILHTNLLSQENALGKVKVTGFPSEQWAAESKKLWAEGNNVYLAGLNEDGSHHQTKYLREADYLPIGSIIKLDDRDFRVEHVNFTFKSVSLQDMELTKNRLPIFRNEHLPHIRELYEEQQDAVIDVVPEKEVSYQVGDEVVVDLPTRTIEGTIGYVGETDVRIDTSAHGHSWDNEVINRQQFEEGLRQKEPDEPELTDEELDELPISAVIDGEVQTFPNAAALDEALHAEPVPEPAGNFHITDEHLGEGGAKQKYARNIEAIKTLFRLEEEHRGASAEEQEVLAQYVGWGGLADAFDPNKDNWAKEYTELKGMLSEDEYAAARGSVLNAHYTSPTVIRAIYDAVEKMGFRSGNILEPSMGVGNFFGMLPDTMQDSRLYGVELDSITGRIAQKLYPQADITVAGFETTDRRDFYDLAVGNVPFGNYKVADKAYTKMRNVAGLSTSEAQKSSDMFGKCRYLDEITGGRGVIFATGTPISNSMTEMYTLMRYLQYNTLQQKGLTHFDAWASTFGETTTAIELAPEGTGYRARTRFAKFFNVPELMAMFKEAADIKTSDQLNLPVPEAKFETVVVKPSEIQKDMVQALSERAAEVHSGSVDPSVDNMLKITSDGRKIGLDQRLMNSALPDDPSSKLNACVNNVLRIWNDTKEQKLTQLIFCDMSTPKGDGSFNVYDDIRSKLLNAGVPEQEIEFIHNADTENKKAELFSKVRSGQVRVLLGSTAKMGAGTNVQTLLVAVHHLDVGWRPSDMTQRNGRIIRQGNQNKQVYVYNYVTEGTFDGYLWQTLESKQKFISQIMTSKSPMRSCDDIDEQALSYAEIKALCAGDPRIREKMDLDVQVAKLKVLRGDFQNQKYRLEDKLLKTFPEEIQKQKTRIAALQQDSQTAAAHPQDKENFCGMTIKGMVYDDKKVAGERLLLARQEMPNADMMLLGTYRGFELNIRFDSFKNEHQAVLRAELSYPVSLGDDARGNITRLDNAIDNFADRIADAENALQNLEQQKQAAEIEVAKPFAQEEELAEKSARLAELNALLNIDRDRSSSQDAPEETEKTESPAPRPSVLAALEEKVNQSEPVKPFRSYYDKDGDAR